MAVTESIVNFNMESRSLGLNGRLIDVDGRTRDINSGAGEVQIFRRFPSLRACLQTMGLAKRLQDLRCVLADK